MQGIYEIRNKVSGKRYIGSSNDIKRRWEEHRKELQKGIHHSVHLQRAWDKYGVNNFEFGVIKGINDEKVRLGYEQKCLDDGFSKGLLYNISVDASSGMGGREHSEETCRKMKGRIPWNKGIPRSPECIYKLSEAGKKYFETHEVWNKRTPRSEECKVKISEANKGKSHPHTEETKQKLSEDRQGEDNPFYGKTHSEETKIVLSIKSKEWHRTHENSSAKSYPAFYNERTGEFISAGRNLAQLCREYQLASWPMYALRSGLTQCSRTGWCLTTEQEITQLQGE